MNTMVSAYWSMMWSDSEHMFMTALTISRGADRHHPQILNILDSDTWTAVTVATTQRRGFGDQMGFGSSIRMVLLERFLDTPAGILLEAEVIRVLLQCLDCAYSQTLDEHGWY